MAPAPTERAHPTAVKTPTVNGQVQDIIGLFGANRLITSVILRMKGVF